MFTSIFLLSLFTLANSNLLYIGNNCDYSKELCLDTFYCSWCNVSTIINDTEYFTEVCNYNEDICMSNFNESSMCSYQDNYNSSCNFYETFTYILIIFILTTSSYTITYSLIKNFSIENQTRIFGFAFIILMLINIPAFILFASYSKYFGFYIFCLIILSFTACCTNNTKNYINYRKTKLNGYEPINN